MRFNLRLTTGIRGDLPFWIVAMIEFVLPEITVTFVLLVVSSGAYTRFVTGLIANRKPLPYSLSSRIWETSLGSLYEFARLQN
ncbi:hypothetical protein D3C71_1996750 [compost metagenome]